MSKQAKWTVAMVKAVLPRVPVVDARGGIHLAMMNGSTMPEAWLFAPGSKPGAPWIVEWRDIAAALNAGTRLPVAYVPQ